MKRRPLADDDLPEYAELVAPVREVSLRLVTATPLYGGGAATRRIDPDSPVRSSGIRGQLRFWWRALFGAASDGSSDLWRRERAFWGGLDQKESPTASRVTISVVQERVSEPDSSDVGFGDRAAYALWPARGTRQEPPAERVPEGHAFTLRIRALQGRDWEQVEAVVRAWILFGGVGGRTRRGCGSIALVDPAQRAEWLPESMEPDVLKKWLGIRSGKPRSFAALGSAALRYGGPSDRGVDAWATAIGWLRDFRQGVRPGAVDTAPAGDFARQQPRLAQGNAGRPGRSRWPEPDHIRHLAGQRFHDHPTLIPSTPRSWPRAQFGLPIQVRFQKLDRNKQPFVPGPPRETEILWTPDGCTPSQRLASPVIVKPVQLREGRFVPVALWLDRELPASAQAGLADRPDSLAPMSAMPPSPLYSPLAGKASVKDAFMDWLTSTRRLQGGTL